MTAVSCAEKSQGYPGAALHAPVHAHHQDHRARFSIRGALRKSILRNLGLHYTITHTYNAGQCTHIYLESSNTPTALRR
eukprot:COSAG06_NODE_55380_length_289_cov_12.526316_1_plen_78_part_01